MINKTVEQVDIIEKKEEENDQSINIELQKDSNITIQDTASINTDPVLLSDNINNEIVTEITQPNNA